MNRFSYLFMRPEERERYERERLAAEQPQQPYQQPEYPPQYQTEPPREQPNFFQRMWNGFTNLPIIRTLREWATAGFERLRNFFSVNSPARTNINGVDPRLLHIAAALGCAHGGGCVCTDGNRSPNAGYGARNSRHIGGHALDVRLSSFPNSVRGKRAQEQFVADIATVLGYGSRDPEQTLVASRHDVGHGDHMHFQFGPENLGNVGYTSAGTDVAAARQRLLQHITPDRLAQIEATRAPDSTIAQNNPSWQYSRYETQNRPMSPTLVHSIAPAQQLAPRPQYRPHPEIPVANWATRPRQQA